MISLAQNVLTENSEAGVVMVPRGPVNLAMVARKDNTEEIAPARTRVRATPVLLERTRTTRARMDASLARRAAAQLLPEWVIGMKSEHTEVAVAG